MFGFVGNVIAGVGAALFGNSSKGQDAEQGVNFAQEAARGIGTWIDEREFTEEEKSKVNFETASMLVDVVKTTAQSNSQQSQARRQMAWLILRVYLGFMFLSGALYRVDQAWSEYIFKLANDTYIGELTVGVGAFYFLTHALRARK